MVYNRYSRGYDDGRITISAKEYGDLVAANERLSAIIRILKPATENIRYEPIDEVDDVLFLDLGKIVAAAVIPVMEEEKNLCVSEIEELKRKVNVLEVENADLTDENRSLRGDVSDLISLRNSALWKIVRSYNCEED